MLTGITYLPAKDPITIRKSISKIYFLIIDFLPFSVTKHIFGFLVNNKVTNHATLRFRFATSTKNPFENINPQADEIFFTQNTFVHMPL